MGVRTPAGTILDAGGEWTEEQWIGEWEDEYVQIYAADDFLPDTPEVQVLEVTDLDTIGHDLDWQDFLRINGAVTAVLSIHHTLLTAPALEHMG